MYFNLTIALIILFRIGLFAYFVVTDGNYIHPDSPIYIELANNLIENHVFELPSNPPDEVRAMRVFMSAAPPGPDAFRTPGYPAFLALIKSLGMTSLYWVVFFQELIYGFAVWIFYRYAKQLFNTPIFRASLVFLLLDPGGLAFPKLLISEVLFLPFLWGGIIAIGLYLNKSNWRYIVIAGVLMGLGAIVRPAIVYLPVVVAATLVAFDLRNKLRWGHSGVFLLSFVLCISPWLIRNYIHFDKVFMSGQKSNMLANYHVPMLWHDENIISYYEGQNLIQQQVAIARHQREHKLGRPVNAAEFFQLQQQIAINEIVKYPDTYFLQWLHGSLKTMYEPFVIELCEVLKISDDRIHFSELLSAQVNKNQTVGSELSIKDLFGISLYYIFNQDRLYLLILIFTLLIFAFAMPGAISIIRKKECFLWLLLLVNCYFIAAPGSMGYARFRFPVGLFWFIQAGMGYYGCLSVINKWRFRKQSRLEISK